MTIITTIVCLLGMFTRATCCQASAPGSPISLSDRLSTCWFVVGLTKNENSPQSGSVNHGSLTEGHVEKQVFGLERPLWHTGHGFKLMCLIWPKQKQDLALLETQCAPPAAHGIGGHWQEPACASKRFSANAISTESSRCNRLWKDRHPTDIPEY